MGGVGADAAIEAADIVLMDDDPAKIAQGVRHARRTMRIVHQNIIFALAVKLLVMVLGICGFANMWLAVFADVGVAMLAILNAMRAMKMNQYWKKRRVPRRTKCGMRRLSAENVRETEIFF